MPKENIYGEHGTESVEVTWGKNGEHVQVGTRAPNSPFALIPEGAVPGVDCVSGPYTSLHITLTNRSEVNDLIRVLRKARDQAFGADA